MHSQCFLIFFFCISRPIQAFPWYPDATNRASSSLFTEMASNLSEGFANLGDLCVQKLRSLDAIREEVHFNKDETNVENEC